MANITIRHANEKDLGVLQELLTQFYTEEKRHDSTLSEQAAKSEAGKKYFMGYIDSKEKIMLVAENEGTVVGCVSGEINRDTVFRQAIVCKMSELFVRPEFRRQGIATRLYKALEDWAAPFKPEQFRLRVFAANHAAQNLYKQEGFTPLLTVMTKDIS